MKYIVYKTYHGAEFGEIDLVAQDDQDAIEKFAQIVNDTAFKRGLQLDLYRIVKARFFSNDEMKIATAKDNEEIVVHEYDSEPVQEASKKELLNKQIEVFTETLKKEQIEEDQIDSVLESLVNFNIYYLTKKKESAKESQGSSKGSVTDVTGDFDRMVKADEPRQFVLTESRLGFKKGDQVKFYMDKGKPNETEVFASVVECEKIGNTYDIKIVITG